MEITDNPLGLREVSQKILNTGYEFLNLLYDSRYESYLVGGCVRDSLLNTQINDIDVATPATPEQIKIFAEQNNLKYIETGIEHGTVTIIYKDVPIQVTTFRIDKNCDGRHADIEFVRTLKEDLKRRDFTINAIAIDKDDNLIDYFCGISDISRSIIKSVGNPIDRYNEDKLRAMRAIRFSTTLNFKIEKDTFNAINSLDISSLSKERIRDEFAKILESPNRLKGLQYLDESGLLKQIIPELETLKEIDQDLTHHPEKYVFTHTLKVIENLLPESSLELVLAALLHDISKPETRILVDNKIHFYEHESKGAVLAEEILKKLKFKSFTVDKVKWLVANHMRIFKFNEMKKSKKIKLIQLEYFNDLVELFRSDVLSSSYIGLSIIKDIVNFLTSYELELKRRPVLKEKLVNGYDIIALGVDAKTQGILIGQILEKIEDEIIEGNINTKEEALKRVEEFISINNGNESL